MPDEENKQDNENENDLYGEFGRFVHESKSRPLTQDELMEVFSEIRTGETVNVYAS